MQKHPNEFTRRQIEKFFSSRHFELKVVAVQNSYVIFFVASALSRLVR